MQPAPRQGVGRERLQEESPCQNTQLSQRRPRSPLGLRQVMRQLGWVESQASETSSLRCPQADGGDTVVATKEPWMLCPGRMGVHACLGPLSIHGLVRPAVRTHLPSLGWLQSPCFSPQFPSRRIGLGCFYTSALPPSVSRAPLVNSSEKWGSFSKEEAGGLGEDRSI